MDTGWFRHSNTRAGTLRAVAELIDAGAQVDDIYRKLFERNTLGRSEAHGGNARRACKPTWMEESPTRRFRTHDLLRTGAIPPDSEDLVDYTVSMRGVEVGMLFIEQARGRCKGVVPGSQRPGLFAAWPPSSAAAATAKRPERPCRADVRGRRTGARGGATRSRIGVRQ